MNKDIVKIIEDNYPLSEEQNKIWEDIKKDIDREKSDFESLYDLNKKLSKLGDSHTYIKRLKAPQYQFVLELAWSEDCLIWVKESKRYLIDKINGLSVAKILETYRKEYGYEETYIKRQIIEDVKWGAGEFQKNKLTITYYDEGSSCTEKFCKQDILEMQAAMSEELIELLKNLKTLYGRKISEDTFYIKISSFYDRNMVSKFIEMVKENVDHETKNIIFDIRNNSGGYINIAKEMVSCVVDNKILMNYEVIDKQGNRKRHEIPNKIIRELRGKKLWLFVNQNTQSSAEYIFGRGIKIGNSAVTIVGQKSAGMSGQARELIIDNKIFMSVTTKRYVEVGTDKAVSSGVIPDMQIVEPLNGVEDMCMKWYLENKCLEGEHHEHCTRG